MAKKYPRSEALEEAARRELGGPAYVTWAGETISDEALSGMSGALEEYTGVQRTKARYWRDMSDLQTNVSGRPSFERMDYDAHRPEHADPWNRCETYAQVDWAYHHVGIVRNVIDLMGDFGSQGIRLVHQSPRQEKFWQAWARQVGLVERSERFLNSLYRLGVVVLRKQFAKIKTKQQERMMKSLAANTDMEIHTKKIVPKEIPWKYTFLHPGTVDVVGGSLATFVGSPRYCICLPRSLCRIIKNPKTQQERELVAKLPKEIVAAAKTNKPVVLPEDKTEVYHYKKDDWCAWAKPMIYSVLDDIKVIEKLKLADMAALDGAISNIRIFKLGSLEHKIAPTDNAAAKLAEILQGNVGGGTMDLIWGPDIELIESKTTVHQFLGSEKYNAHWTHVHAGLGVPSTLTGLSTSGGTTNNYISLKTLVQRLNYGRQALKEFWEGEIKIVQEAMGFRFPAKVEFDYANLGDETAERNLLLQLSDRNLISDELLQHRLDMDPELERLRQNKESKMRETGRMVPKSNSYNDPQFGWALKKIALQSGVSTPGQVGLRSDEPRSMMKMHKKEKGEKPALEMRQPPKPPGSKGPAPKKKGQPQQGRPKNSKDSTKRKEKTFKPKTKAVLEIWAKHVQVALSGYLNQSILETYDKKNMRSLSAAETERAEHMKFAILCNLAPLGIIDEEAVTEAAKKPIPVDMEETYNTWKDGVAEEMNRTLTFDELHTIQACVYAAFYGED